MNLKTKQNFYKNERAHANYPFKPYNTSYVICVPIFLLYLGIFISIIVLLPAAFFTSLMCKYLYKFMPYIYENMNKNIVLFFKILGYPANTLINILINDLWLFNKSKWFQGLR